MAKTYDQKCFDLAEHFIGDGPPGSAARLRCHELALEIQTVIENWQADDDLKLFMATQK